VLFPVVTPTASTPNSQRGWFFPLLWHGLRLPGVSVRHKGIVKMRSVGGREEKEEVVVMVEEKFLELE